VCLSVGVVTLQKMKTENLYRMPTDVSTTYIAKQTQSNAVGMLVCLFCEDGEV
jgi:hypothetical protein